MYTYGPYETYDNYTYNYTGDWDYYKISVATQIGENLKYKVSETWNGLLVNGGVYMVAAGTGNVISSNTFP